jgi:hypothetical protein
MAPSYRWLGPVEGIPPLIALWRKTHVCPSILSACQVRLRFCHVKSAAHMLELKPEG